MSNPIVYTFFTNKISVEYNKYVQCIAICNFPLKCYHQYSRLSALRPLGGPLPAYELNGLPCLNKVLPYLTLPYVRVGESLPPSSPNAEFPGYLPTLFPGGGKRRDPGNEVGYLPVGRVIMVLVQFWQKWAKLLVTYLAFTLLRSQNLLIEWYMGMLLAGGSYPR